MILTLADAKYLKESISIISDLVKEATFNITNDGLELIAMDPATVAMVIFKLLPSSFVEYSIEQPMEIAINLDNFKQILRRAKTDDIVSLSVNENTLEITLKSKHSKKFNLPIIELDNKEQKIPSLEFSTKIDIPSSMLSEAIEDSSIVSDAVAFIAQPEGFSVKAEGDLSKAEINMAADENLKVNSAATTRSKYSIDYLKKMISGSKLSETAQVEFAESYPLKLSYKVVDKVLLSFILAPRMEND